MVPFEFHSITIVLSSKAYIKVLYGESMDNTFDLISHNCHHKNSMLHQNDVFHFISFSNPMQRYTLP